MSNNKYNILLVEDNEGDIWLAKEAFGRYRNYEITVQSNGNEAIEYLLKRVAENPELSPDLIFLDLNLPGKNGWEILEIIKNNRTLRLIPVIIMSTDDSRASVNMVYDLHANCFIVKPVDVEEYFKIIDTIDRFWFKTVRLPFYEEKN
ncbi:response regulator [bacterium]|nr:response regulator [bacterium]